LISVVEPAVDAGSQGAMIMKKAPCFHSVTGQSMPFDTASSLLDKD
jgi:hypothetical protein